MRKNLKRFISAFLSIVMAVTTMPSATYAMEEYKSDYEFSSKDITIEYEIENKRTENSKTYITDDGAYYQVSSATPIHEKINGEWQNIKNIDENVSTADDAENVVLELASSYNESEYEKSGIKYENPNQIFYGYPNLNDGVRKINSNDESCIYVTPSIVDDNTVYIYNSTINLKVSNESAGDVYAYPLSVSPTDYLETNGEYTKNKLSYNKNLLLDKSEVIAESDGPCVTLDITKYSSYCSLGILNNNGIALTYENQNGKVASANIPINTVTVTTYYREIGEVDKVIGCETVDTGRGGTVYINDYSCTPIVVRNDLGIFDELEEVDIQTIINPIAIDEYEYDGTNSRTNYFSTLKAAGNEYYWKNCSGNYITFTCVNSDDAVYIGHDTWFEYYKLNVYKNKIEITQGKESESVHPKYTFNQIGDEYRLVQYNDGYNNLVTINYANDKINYIEDGSSRRYKFYYDNNQLKKIGAFYISNDAEEAISVNNQNIEINYFYDIFGRFKSVAYPDGYTVQYDYMSNDSNEDNRLSKISVNDGEKEINHIEFTYRGIKSNILKEYEFVRKTAIETVEISDINRSLYYRIFKKNVSDPNDTDSSYNPSTKIVKYNSKGNVELFKSYDDEEYYIDYEDENVSKIILDETDSQNQVTNGDFNSDTNWSLSDNAKIISKAPNQNNNQPNSTGTEKALKISNAGGEATYTINKFFAKNTLLVFSCSSRCEQTLPTGAENNFYASLYSGNNELKRIEFDYMTEGRWQTDKILVTLPSNVTNLKIKLGCIGMPGACYFDNVQLYKATNSIIVPEIEGFNITRNDNGTTNNIIEVGKENPEFLGKHYEYDENSYISSIDDKGKKVFYQYNKKNGMLMSKGPNVDNSKNATFSYDIDGTLKMVSQIIKVFGNEKKQNVSYTYDDSLLKSISHNGTTYEYDYNNRDQVTSIKVKENESSETDDYSISYKYLKDKVGKVEFGNGSSITYTYDKNVITSTEYDNGKSGEEHQVFKYLYKYTDDGKLSSVNDELNNIIYSYNNDSYSVYKNGELMYSKNGSNAKLFNKSISENTNGSTITSTAPSSTITYNETLDGLQRTTSSSAINKIKKGTLTHDFYKVDSSIIYQDNVNQNNKTTLVQKYVTSVNKRSSTILEKYENTRLKRVWFYEYDDAGRVSKIYKKSLSNVDYSNEDTSISSPDSYSSSDLVHYYEYAEGGEISIELDLEAKKVTYYYYNEGGNLISKYVYSNQNNNDGFSYSIDSKTGEIKIIAKNCSERIKYSYQSNGMTDYLTSFNGNIITYDAAGNPIKYSGNNIYGNVYGDMEWNGNLLTSFTTSNSQYVYTYDAEGKRVSKTYYGYKSHKELPTYIIEYIWNGDKLVGYHTKRYTETNNKSDYELIWDKVIKLNYNGKNLIGASVEANTVNSSLNKYSDMFNWAASTAYSFVSDGQGNITDIYDFNEKIVVSFSYDSYGNITPYYTGSAIRDLYENSSAADNNVSQTILEILRKAVLGAYLDGMFLSIEQGYKGCLYDKETGLYYANQRYYSPSWGRYINANDPMVLKETVGDVYGCNLFNYCKNDPVNNVSLTGFNAPSITTNERVISSFKLNNNNMTSESRATAGELYKINNKMSAASFALNSKQNDNTYYYDRLFNRTNNTVVAPYSPDYIFSRINRDTSTVTKYNIEYRNTPYKIASSID